jgi:hypothetical protein
LWKQQKQRFRYPVSCTAAEKKRKKADVNVNKHLKKTTITYRNQEISSQEIFAETWPKMKFLAKCVFFMAKNYLNITWNLQYMRLLSRTKFKYLVWEWYCAPTIIVKFLVFHLNFRMYTGCVNKMWSGQNNENSPKNEENIEFWQISYASVICTKKATQKMSIRINILPCILL